MRRPEKKDAEFLEKEKQRSFQRCVAQTLSTGGHVPRPVSVPVLLREVCC